MAYAILLIVASSLQSQALAPHVKKRVEMYRLVQKVAADHEAGMKKIRTFSCKYRIEDRLDEQLGHYLKLEMPMEGNYWRNGTQLRANFQVKVGSLISPEDFMYHDGKVISLVTHRIFTGSTPTRSLRIFPDSPHLFRHGNIWKQMLFLQQNLLKDGVHLYPFRELLTTPLKLIDASPVIVDGQPLTYVKLEIPGYVMELWFDAKMNGLIRKSNWIPFLQEEYRAEYTVLDCAFSSDHTCVPVVIEGKAYRQSDQQLIAHVQTILSDVKINEPLPADAFQIPNLAGLECDDLIRKTKYVVDEKGNRVGSETPRPPVLREGGLTMMYPTPADESLEHDQSLTKMDLIVAFSVSIVVFGTFLYLCWNRWIAFARMRKS